MIDIQFVRDNPGLVRKKAAQKGFEVDVEQLLKYDSDRKELLAQVEELRGKRNKIAESTKGGKPEESLVEEGRQIKIELAHREEYLKETEEQWLKLLKSIPNMPVDDVPVGASEDENQEVKTWGEKPDFDFEIKNHSEIAEAKGWLDKERGAKVAGTRFVYLKGDLVMLEYALWNFGLSVLTDEKILQKIIGDNDLNVSPKPFIPVIPPAMAKTEVYQATGRLDKEQQTYKLENDELWLNASAEHTLAPMYMGEVLTEADFPIRYVGHTTAFRREAGTYGKDMEGILRLHQFNKLEMESFNLAEASLQEHLFMVAIQEYLMQQLELPYRLLNKCTADIGFPNARGMDIDVWLPAQNKYRETHTADYITDFQARGTNTRVKRRDGNIQFVHNNDATAFSQRPLIAIIENNQQADGSVVVPKVLQKYMGAEFI
ncbi:serine--tRNA ligase [Candidatus Parcubacteria bacterium]|nr:serine--tRNA ligase [Candidatus Parcubacteria bacterium]